jgi:hypothetical protein
MNVYLGKDRQRAEQHLTATHATVINLTRGVEGFWHKLYMDNFFSSPDLYEDLAEKKILQPFRTFVNRRSNCEIQGYEPRPSKPVGRPAQTSTNIGRLNTRHSLHWPNRGNTQRRCRVCSVRGVKRSVKSVCIECDVALCVDRNCFMDYHTKDKL